MNQLSTQIGKNFILHFRSKTFWLNLYIPILCIMVCCLIQDYLIVYLLPIFICLNSNGVLRETIQLIVKERSNKSKDIQLQQGLNPISYYASWIITTVTLTFIISVIFFVPFFIMRLNTAGLASVNVYIFIQGDIMYTIAISAFMLFLSIFFSNPLKASEILSLLNLIFSFASYVNFYPYAEYSFFGQLPAIFLPQSAFQMLLFSQNWIFNEPSACLSQTSYFLFLFFQIIIYFICFVYFDQIQKILKTRICNKCKKQDQIHIQLEEESCDTNTGNPNQQLQRPFLNIYQQDFEIQGQSIIKIENLSYQIRDQPIIKTVNLDVYQNETYCLLGAKGSGKTSLISILQGFTQKTSGTVKIFGQEIDKNGQKQIGLCLQKDILYSDLTVLEHLQLYGITKGISKVELEGQINDILNICQLIGETNLKARQLNNLNSKKLQLAISLIGNPLVLFYDEPSQDLDSVGRQQILQIIRQIRLNRTIIFTSLLFEEAEMLANRIGILINGKIVAQGTPDFIKNNFGIGYNLIMEFTDENQLIIEKPKIQQQLQQIDSFIQAIQRNPKTLFCVLPTNKIDQFHQIFYYLEQNSKCVFQLKQNCLEDIYKTMDQTESQENLDLNTQTIFQQQPQIQISQQIKSLMMRKIMLLTEKEKQFKYMLLYFLITLAVMFGMFSSFRFVLFYLGIKAITCILFTDYEFEDKNTQMKQFLLANGVSIRTYWIGSLLGDLIISFFEGVFTASLLWIYNVGHFAFYYFSVILLITIFGFSLSCHSNFLMHSNQKKSVSVGISFLSLFVFYTLFLVFIVIFIQPGQSASLSLIAMLLMIISPYMACFIGFGMSPSLLNYAIFGYWSCLFFLLLGGGLYFLILISQEQKKFKKIEQEMHDTNAIVDIKDVQWKYGYITTQQKITMQINKQEIFGLVGPKNAGKSEFINLINKYNQPFNGNIRIRDQNNQIGIMPQFSIFKSKFTVQQILEFFGKIKGQQNLHQCIEIFLRAFDIFEIRQKQIQYLNEIESKKLYLGLALIGGSNRLFLDEAFQGLDSKSKRKFSQIIQQTAINNEAAILLTSQSIQDVQTICNKIGIFINGVIIAQGTINELKEQLGNLARFSVRCQIGSREQAHAVICQTLQQFQFTIQPIFDARENFLSYMIPAQQFKLSSLFSFLQLELKQKYQLITDFNIYQPNLEETFEYFASQQMMVLKPNIFFNSNFLEDLHFGCGLRTVMGLFFIFW